MITLSADNRSLLLGQPYTYLSDNNTSGQSSLVVANTAEISTDDFILVELFGNPVAEIFRVGTVTATSNSLQLLDSSGNATTTAFAHSESTRITVIPFNQIRFYWTAATGTISDENPTFNANTPLSGYEALDPTQWFTTYVDNSHSTGFGWFVFYNSVTTDSSQNSNAIPYGGFATNTVQYVFDDFLSLINNKELKLVTQADMFSWLNEGLAIIRNKLNLTNTEYTVSSAQSITWVDGQYEYQLPDDFGDMVAIVDGQSRPVPWISIGDAMAYTGSVLKYYIRGRYLGFVPTPSSDNTDLSAYATVTYRYRSKGSRLTGLDDVVDLPDNGSNVLKDWMMWRACLKFQNPNAQVYYKAFNDGMNQLIVSSIHRDANLDTWGIADYANA